MATGTPADRVHRALPPFRRRYAETTHHAARSSNASPCITSRQGLAATNTSGTLTSARAHPGSRHRCMKSTWTNHNASQWTRSPSLHEAPPFLGAQAYARARLANGHDATSMMMLLQGDQALLQASTLLLDAPARNSVPDALHAHAPIRAHGPGDRTLFIPGANRIASKEQPRPRRVLVVPRRAMMRRTIKH